MFYFHGSASGIASMRSELVFGERTYRRRMETVQRDIRRDGLCAVLLFDPENIYWVSGFQTIGYFTFQSMLLPAEGAPVLISRQVNAFLARATPTLKGFVGIADTDDPVSMLAAHVEARLPSEGPLGVETASWYLTVRDYARLKKLLPRLKMRDWGGVVEALRVRKSPEELDRIRMAARAAAAGVDAALRMIAPGRTENDLAASMHQAAIEVGSEYLGHPPLVVSGDRTALCFAMWRRHELKRGDVVLLESGGCVDRYHAILARSAVIGDSTVEHRRVATTILTALEAAIAAIRPGKTSGAVDEACRQVIRAAGLEHAFVHRTGYSIGIGFPPNWSEGKTLALRPGDKTMLEPGMSFHIVPTLFLDDFGMCFSETVVVTDDGCEVLTDYPRELFECGH